MAISLTPSSPVNEKEKEVLLQMINQEPLLQEKGTDNRTVALKSLTRTSPINEKEKELLLQMISQEPVLQEKGTDNRIVALKHQAWARITAKFNLEGLGPKRSEQQIKKIWERLKVKLKQEHASRKRESYKTGDGPPPTELSDDTFKVLDMIGGEMQDFGNCFDSDSTESENSTSLENRLEGKDEEEQRVVVECSPDHESIVANRDSHFMGPAATLRLNLDPALSSEPSVFYGHQASSGSSGMSELNKKSRKARRSLSDSDMCLSSDGNHSFSVEQQEAQRKIWEGRQKLLNFQLQEAQLRVKEAESQLQFIKYKVRDAEVQQQIVEEKRRKDKLKVGTFKSFVPLFDRVLIQKGEVFTKSSSGILIPEKSNAEVLTGKVVAVGEGARTETGITVPPAVAVGDEVMLPEFGGTKVIIDGKDYYLFRDKELLAKLKSEQTDNS